MKEALYRKIAGALEDQIRSGTMKTGHKMPSLRMLHREYGISLNTAIQTYLELESKGLIVSRPQSGYYVNYKPSGLSIPSISNPTAGYEPEYVETLIARGML